jgi:tetratricopeptide (TPR) repeat protein
MASPSEQDLSRRGEDGALSFGLSLVDRQGIINLARPQSIGPLSLDHLELIIPDIGLSFDLSGGASRFRHRRCRLLRAALHCGDVDAGQWLARRIGQVGPFRELRVHFDQGTFDVAGVAELDSGEAAPFLLTGILQPDGDARALRLALCETRVFGDLPIAAPQLAARLLLAAAGREAPRLQLSGCAGLTFDPLELALLWTLPPCGWRLPALSATRLEDINIRAGELSMSFADAGKGANEEQQRYPGARRRFEAIRRAQQRFSEAEACLLEAPGDALTRYRRHHEERPQDLFALERLLQLTCVDPAHEAENRQLIDHAKSLHPEFVPALLAEAALDLRAGLAAEAAAHYRRIAELSAREGNHLAEAIALQAAGTHSLKRQPEQARVTFERLLELEGDSGPALNGLARIYADAEAWEDLVTVRRRQLELAASTEARLHTRLALGELYRVHLADPTAAQDQYEQALSADPSCEPALRGLAAACIDSENPRRAIEVLDTLRERVRRRGDSDSEVALQLRTAALLEHLKDNDAALTRLQLALELRPDDPEALRRTAALLEAMGHETEAAELLERLLPRVFDQAGQVEVHRQLAELWLSIDNLDESQRQLQQALALDPDDLAALKLAILVADKRDDSEMLAEVLERAAAAERDGRVRAEMLLRQGRLLAEQDSRLEDAAGSLKRAIQDGLPEEKAEQTWVQIIEIHIDQGNAATAARAAEAAAATFDSPERRAEWLFRAGELWRKQVVDQDRALWCYQEAAKNRPHLGALDALESHFTDEGDVVQLVEVLNLKVAAAVKRPSIQKALLLRRGELLLQVNRRQDALADFKRALALDRDYTPALLQLARNALAHAETDAAEEYYRRLAACLSQTDAGTPPEQRQQNQVEAYLHLAELSRAKGNQREEEGHLEMALALDPRNATVLELLDDLLAEQDRTSELIGVLQRRCNIARDKATAIERELRLGALLETLPGKQDEAVMAYQKVLRIEPSNTVALQHLSKILRETRRFGELVDVLVRRAELAEESQSDPKKAVALLLEAARIVERRLVNRDRARDLLQQALRLAPQNAEVIAALLNVAGDEALPKINPGLLLTIAQRHRKEGHEDAAAQALRAALRHLTPGPDRARAARELLEVIDQGQEELPALLILLEDGATPDEMLRLAHLLNSTNQREKALEVLRQLPEELRSEDEIQQLLWDDLEGLARFSELAEELESHAGQQRDPTRRREVLLRAARIWADKAGDLERGEQAMLAAARIDPFELGFVDAIFEVLTAANAADRFPRLLERLLEEGDGYTIALRARVMARAAKLRREAGAAWREVEAAYREALDLDANCIDALEALISLYGERQDHERLAAALISRAELGGDLEARCSALIHAAATTEGQLQRPKDAKKLLERARELRPEDARAAAALADLHLSLGDLREAERTLVTLADLAEGEPERALERAAGLARIRGDSAAEARYLAKLASHRPEDRQIAARLAEAFRAADDPREQCAALERLAHVEIEALLEAATIHLDQLGDAPAAHGCLALLIDERPEHLAALGLMFRTCEQLGRNQEATDYLRRSCEVEQPGAQRLERITGLARRYEENGDLEAEGKAWRRCLEEAPTDTASIDGLAQNLARRKAWEELCILLEETLAAGGLIDAHVGRLATLLGETYLDHLKDEESGIRWLRRACAITDNERTYSRLVTPLRERKDYTEVAEVLNLRLERIPDESAERPHLLEELGQVLEVHLDDLLGAAEAYAAAYQHDPAGKLDCAIRAQELFARVDELDRSLALLDQAITRVKPEIRGRLLARRAHILSVRGMIQQSIEEYERALANDPSLIQARADLGRQLFGLGRFDEAIPYLRAAARDLDNPKEAASCDFLAKRALEKLGPVGDIEHVDQLPEDEDEEAVDPWTDKRYTDTAPMPTVSEPKRPDREPQPAADEAPPPATKGAKEGGAEQQPKGLKRGSTQPGLHTEEANPVQTPDEEPMDRSGWQQLADAYREQAERNVDPSVRAELLMKAARVTEEHLSRPLEAIGIYEEAAANAPDYQEAVETLADAAYRNQDWHRARELYDRLWRSKTKLPQPELCYRRAVIYEALGDDRTADACYADAVKLNPTHRAALEGRARVALCRDDISAAIEALSGLVELITLDEIDALVETREKLGELYLLSGNPARAREYLEACLALDPRQKKVMQTLITVYQTMGEFEAMADLLDQLNRVTTNPLVRASLLHYRAEILGMELGDEAAAVDCLLRAYDLAPQYPPTLWRLIDYFWERDDLESVAEMGVHLKASTDLERESADLRYVKLAVATLVTDGDREEARRLLEVVLRSRDLAEPAVLDLAHATTLEVVGNDDLMQLIAAADVEGLLFEAAARLVEADPDIGGLKVLVDLLKATRAS